MISRGLSAARVLRQRQTGIAAGRLVRWMGSHSGDDQGGQASSEAEQRSSPPGETPGDEPQRMMSRSERRQIIDRMLRVDHAGESAAVLIYEGQSAVLGKTSEGPCLAEMAEHEREHLQKFQDLVRKRRQAALPARAEQRAPAPPSASPGISDAERKHPLTSAAGAGSALLGKEAAYAVTEAVEEVISEHYNAQLRELLDSGLQDEEELREVFRKFRDDEMAHLNTAVEKDSRLAPMYTPLTQTVKLGCRAAIWIAEKV